MLSFGPARRKKYLILLACDDYKYLECLQACVNDAELLARRLDSQYEVLARLYNSQLTLFNFMQTLQKAKKTVDKHSTVVLFFAGHGVHEESTNRSFLCMHDTSINELLVNAFDMQFLRLYCDHISARRQLYIIDACHSAFVMRCRRASNPTPLETAYPVIKCISSAQSHQAAVEVGCNSLFTRSLVDVIEPRKLVTDVFCEVRQKMRMACFQQMPVLGNLVTQHRGLPCIDGDMAILD